MIELSKRFTLWGVALLLCMTLLAACGDDATPTPTVTEPPTAAVDSTPTTDEVATATSAVASTNTVETAGVVSPTVVSEPEATATATLTAEAAAEAAAESDCTVEPSPDLIGYADVVTRLGCPIADATNDPVGINEFGDGPEYQRFMLWFGSEGQIYVLSQDGRWLAYTDTWQEGDAEIACNPENLDPATSPPLPRRGFGKLWCTVDTVRIAMGPIDREERLCQHSVVQRFERGRLLACFEDATIRYFRILDDGAWDMEMVQ